MYKTNSFKAERPIRRSQLISPWGIGAIVPFPGDESLMIAGLDKWNYNGHPEDFLIVEERLRTRLGVKELRWPPDFREKGTDKVNYNLTIPAVRFPTWCYCPFCGTMQKIDSFRTDPRCDAYQWPNRRNCSKKIRGKRKLIPERFIVVCPNGHIDDFPIIEWLHSDGVHKYDPKTCHHIRRSTGGTSASLTSVKYTCTCGAEKSIAGALRKGALAKIKGYKCKGSKPWLGISEDNEHPCNCKPEDIKVVQRGATNVWFPVTISSIHIPTDDEKDIKKINQILNEHWVQITSKIVDGQTEPDPQYLEMIANLFSVDPQQFKKAVHLKLCGPSCQTSETVTINDSEDNYRYAEYKMLKKSSGHQLIDFYSTNYSIKNYNPRIQEYFTSISLVKKLRETRAFVGFTRLEPNTGKTIKDLRSMIQIKDDGWLPAIEVFGEGIFFEFNKELLGKWASGIEVKERMRLLNNAYQVSLFSKSEPGILRPEFILVHTFAHLLINQLSYECGYGSSSLRERIYCERCGNNNRMCGVLIYTASGDSEGSLGGLVRQGNTGRLEDTIIAAMENAKWCSSDPICINSSGQGPESLNLAACHNCALLPETCCECGNRLLDRGLVLGTLDNRDFGYFSSLFK